MAFVNPGRPQTWGTQANQDAIIAAVEGRFGKCSCDIARKLSIFQTRDVDVHFDDQLDPCQFSRDAQLSPYGRSICLLYEQQRGAH